MVDQLLVDHYFLFKTMMDLLEKFDAIKLEIPVDKIIHQIRKSIVTGQINPGDRLPSERQLSEKFGIGSIYLLAKKIGPVQEK